MSLNEISELWSHDIRIPSSLILRELQLGILNLPRLQNGELLISRGDLPSGSALPDPADTTVDRDWITRFAIKQNWPSPRFWPTGDEEPPREVGRPGNPTNEPILEELKRRAEAGLLKSTLINEARHLHSWATAQLREVNEPNRPEVIAILIREEYHHLNNSEETN